MQFRFWYLFAFIALVIGGFSVYSNPSYEKSLEAKYYYYTSDYTEALKLAQEAFRIDKYNRMASTIMVQSQLSLQYKSYIEDGKKYMKLITAMAAQQSITKADKARVRLMCEIMIDRYKKMSSTVVIDTALIKEAKIYYLKFKKLYEEVATKV